jgi:hypothetical protein
VERALTLATDGKVGYFGTEWCANLLGEQAIFLLRHKHRET